MNISKYFWDLSEKALRETRSILKDPNHPRFAMRMVSFLSRCNKPKELFAIIHRKGFIDAWPRIRAYWIKFDRQSTSRDWWQAIYEQILGDHRLKPRKIKGKPAASFKKIGKIIRQARIKKGLTQKELSSIIGMKQPDISTIEEGKKNITLYSLMRICKILGISQIDID